jgi:hypothetical protein
MGWLIVVVVIVVIVLFLSQRKSTVKLTAVPERFVVVDLETTGLDAASDEMGLSEPIATLTSTRHFVPS